MSGLTAIDAAVRPSVGAEPLLAGDPAVQAREAASTYARALLEREPEVGPTLAHGDAGLALVHAALERVFPGRGHAERSDAALARALHAAGRGGVTASLWDGIAGTAWVASELGAFGPADESPFDEALERMLARGSPDESHDLIGGLAGLATYALRRLPNPAARRVLDAIVERLAATAEERDEGVAWRSKPEWIPEAIRREQHVEWNMGLAHGVPGVIAVLARTSVAAAATPRARRTARALCAGAFRWVLSNELAPGAGGSFPRGVGVGAQVTAARSAWCYGDPGVAAALMVAAERMDDATRMREATRIALVAAAKPESASGIDEAGLCHGAAGLGHVFHSLYRATGDARLAASARAWFGRALAMKDRRARYLWTESVSGARRSRPGLITGGGGVVLALLTATGDIDSSWDRPLALPGGALRGTTLAPPARSAAAE